MYVCDAKPAQALIKSLPLYECTTAVSPFRSFVFSLKF